MADIRLTGVKKSYTNKLQVIHGVDVAIADGEFIVIVGPSGCGKSTLLRMIAGLETITEGEIAIAGKRVNDVEPKDRNIAMVFQNYALYPHMTRVREHVVRPSHPRACRSADIETRVQRAAKILELGPFLAAQAARALRRAAPARGHGARDRARARGVPLRRAAVEPGREAARADAPRDPEAAPRAEDHQHLRHPRPGRGDDARRPHDRDEPGPWWSRSAGPIEVYDNPASLFVAGFIGSPAMNFLPGQARGRRGRRGRGRAHRRCPPELRADGAGERSRWACVPSISSPRAARARVFRLKVDTVEALGADSLLHCAFGGGTLVVRVDGHATPRAGHGAQRLGDARQDLLLRHRDGQAARGMTLDARRLEELSLNSSAPPGQLLYDGWLLRLQPGKAKRARSVNAVYRLHACRSAEKIAYCERLYARRGLARDLSHHAFHAAPGPRRRARAPRLRHLRRDGGRERAIVPAPARGAERGRDAAAAPNGSKRWASCAALRASSAPGTARASRVARCEMRAVADRRRRRDRRDRPHDRRGRDAAGLFDIVTHEAHRRRGLRAPRGRGAAAPRRGSRRARGLPAGRSATTCPHASSTRQFGFAERYLYWYRGREGERH